MEEVIIELKNNQDKDATTYQANTSAGGSNVTIIVTRSFYPLDQGSAANFYEYKHEDSGGQKFTLIKVSDGRSNHIPVINRTPNVTSVSAYYWRRENGGPNTALLLIVTTKGGKNGTAYYANTDNKWMVLTGHTQPPLKHYDFERTLDDLVCQHHNAVIIDLTGDTSSAVATGSKHYCCRCHGPKDRVDQRKITVEQKKVFCIHKGKNYFQYFEQSVNPGGTKLAGIKYYPKGTNANDPNNRRRIKLAEQDFPIPSVESVYALNCGGNPKIIYVEGGTISGNTWYKKGGDSSNGDEEWEKVELNGITPDNFGSLECSQYNDLVQALKSTGGCSSLKTCPPDPKPRAESDADEGKEPEEAEKRKDEEQAESSEDEKTSEQLAAAGPDGDKASGSPGNDGPTGPGDTREAGNGGTGPTEESPTKSSAASQSPATGDEDVEHASTTPITPPTSSALTQTQSLQPGGTPDLQAKAEALAVESGGIIAILTGAGTYGVISGPLAGAGGLTGCLNVLKEILWYWVPIQRIFASGLHRFQDSYR